MLAACWGRSTGLTPCPHAQEAAFACQYIHDYQISWAKHEDAAPESAAPRVSSSLRFQSAWLLMLTSLSSLLGLGRQSKATTWLPAVLLVAGLATAIRAADL